MPRMTNEKRHGPQISGLQCCLARKLLNWSQRDLALASGIDVQTISAFELRRRNPHTVTVHSLHHALGAAGVEFTNGDQPGVRMRKTGKQK